MFERFTERAWLVMVAAQEEARALGHHRIGSEHLLLGLLNAQGGSAPHVLRAAGITAEAARIERHLGIEREAEPTGGFRTLLLSVGQHLSNIERHLGVRTAAEAEAAGEGEGEGATGTQGKGPTACAE